MAFTERLKKVKKAAVMTGLAVAGVIAPVKAQTAEAVPEKAAVTEAAEHTDAQKKKQFEAAVRTGAPKEEIAKYMDFPGFIPVTKDGQFDEKKASDWAEKLAPYMKVLAERGETMSAADAYKAFKETTGQKDVSLEDFKQTYKMTKDALNKHTDKLAKLVTAIPATLIGLGIASLLFLGKKRKPSSEEVFGKGVDSIILLALATATTIAGIQVVDGIQSTPKKEIDKAYSRMYDTYVDKTIDAQKKQFQQMEWNQVKQALSPQK